MTTENQRLITIVRT